MRVAFYASYQGMGHSVRSEALRQEFLRAGYDARWTSDAWQPHLLIVDSYDERVRMGAVNHRLFNGVRICFIDDYGGPLTSQANCIINGSIPGDLKYAPVVGQTLLFGPQYCLLRPEFRDLSPHEIRPKVERVLVTMGGSPEGIELAKEIGTSIKEEFPDTHVRILTGQMSAAQVVEAMSQADIAISSGGMTLYELLAVGVSTIAIQTAENQRYNLEALKGKYISVCLLPRINMILYWIEILSDLDVRWGFSLRGQHLIDGYGTERVRMAIESMWEKM